MNHLYHLQTSIANVLSYISLTKFNNIFKGVYDHTENKEKLSIKSAF